MHAIKALNATLLNSTNTSQFPLRLNIETLRDMDPDIARLPVHSEMTVGELKQRIRESKPIVINGEPIFTCAFQEYDIGISFNGRTFSEDVTLDEIVNIHKIDIRARGCVKISELAYDTTQEDIWVAKQKIEARTKLNCYVQTNNQLMVILAGPHNETDWVALDEFCESEIAKIDSACWEHMTSAGHNSYLGHKGYSVVLHDITDPDIIRRIAQR